MIESDLCAECGEPIGPTDVLVRMATQIEVTPPGSAQRQWRDDLVLHYHAGCAPGELAGVWRRVD